MHLRQLILKICVTFILNTLSPSCVILKCDNKLCFVKKKEKKNLKYRNVLQRSTIMLVSSWSQGKFRMITQTQRMRIQRNQKSQRQKRRRIEKPCIAPNAVVTLAQLVYCSMWFFSDTYSCYLVLYVLLYAELSQGNCSWTYLY